MTTAERRNSARRQRMKWSSPVRPAWSQSSCRWTSNAATASSAAFAACSPSSGRCRADLYLDLPLAEAAATLGILGHHEVAPQWRDPGPEGRARSRRSRVGGHRRGTGMTDTMTNDLRDYFNSVALQRRRQASSTGRSSRRGLSGRGQPGGLNSQGVGLSVGRRRPPCAMPSGWRSCCSCWLCYQ